MPSRPYRQAQVANLIRNALTKILTQGTFPDHYLNGYMLTITRLEISPDLRIVDCYLIPLLPDNQVELAATIKKLNAHKSLIRQQLNLQVKLRYSPELRFLMDRGLTNAQKVDEVYAKYLEGHEE